MAQNLSERYWPTEKALTALDGRPPINLDQDALHQLAAELIAMDAESLIGLGSWPAALALVEASGQMTA